MAHSKTKYNWTGGDSQSAEDRALDTFAELMIDRIQTIDQDLRQAGSPVCPPEKRLYRNRCAWRPAPGYKRIQCKKTCFVSN